MIDDREMRLQWIQQIIIAAGIAKGFRPSDDQAASDAKIEEQRFAHVATEDFSDLFDHGQKCFASTVVEFLQVWSIELQGRQREAEIEKRHRQAQEEQLRLTSPHPVRDAVFREWGFM